MSFPNDVLVNRRIIVITAAIKKESKFTCSHSNRGLDKSPVHDAPAPWAATELNMRAPGESGDGAKCLSLNSRGVTCEHSAVKRDP